MLLFFPRPAVDYPRSVGRVTVEKAGELVRDSDGLVLSPHSSWAVACYGPWRFELVRSGESTNGFVAMIRRPYSVTLREPIVRNDTPPDRTAFARPLESLLGAQPPRLFYLSVHPSRPADDWAPQTIESNGYIRRASSAPDDPLLMFEREAANANQVAPGPH